MARRTGSWGAPCGAMVHPARQSGQRLVRLTGCPVRRTMGLLGLRGGWEALWAAAVWVAEGVAVRCGWGAGWLFVAGQQGPGRGLARAGSLWRCLVRAVGAVAGGWPVCGPLASLPAMGSGWLDVCPERNWSRGGAGRGWEPMALVGGADGALGVSRRGWKWGRAGDGGTARRAGGGRLEETVRNRVHGKTAPRSGRGVAAGLAPPAGGTGTRSGWAAGWLRDG